MIFSINVGVKKETPAVFIKEIQVNNKQQD